MKTLLLTLGLACSPLLMMAQPDTLMVPAPPTPPAPSVVPSLPEPPAAPENRTVLKAGVNAQEGGYVKVENEDTTAQNGTMSIDLKRKRILITTEPRTWESDTDSLEDRLKELRRERRNQFTYWSGLDLGVNTLLGPDGDADLDKEAEFMQIDNARSRFFSINFMEQKIEFGTHHVGLLTGLGWEFVNYQFQNNTLLAYNADSVYAVPVESPEFRKNKLRQMGFRVPLMLEFNTKRAKLPTAEQLAQRQNADGTPIAQGKNPFDYNTKRNFHIALGVVGSWYFDTMYKQKYRVDGNDRKDRDKGDLLLLPYRAAAAVRVGYGSLNLFAEYSLTPLFKENKGPELTPLTVGLTIVGFN